ncbi:hypothetical protein FB384_000731 [Prauserella sediminis]|uniref:DUF3152 domain-containing protein n=1 Tax=Prauserella sediminis TaxID=577680 RepID=A0A839XH69_9PSEU|nr:DUF3152 domain-containing protein [Prauserella sediminis]MBB3661827.1 hypothetical protein [Prauserella sediminis]
MDRVSHEARREDERTGYSGRGPGRARRTRAPGARPLDERYGPGVRRPGEPLRASWRPHDHDYDPDAELRESHSDIDVAADHDAHGADSGGERRGGRPKKSKSGLRKLIATYGWRVYAIPVLLVVTALVVVDTTKTDPDEPGAQAGDASVAADAGESGGRGGVDEIPAGKQDLNIPTAELPDGSEFTRRGQGTWHVVPGGSDPVGAGGRLLRYTIEVEDGIDPAGIAGEDSYASTVEAILADDDRGWVSSGDVRLQRVDDSGPEADFYVRLTTPETAKDVCGDAIPYPASCHVNGEVVINLARWVRGAKAFSSDLTAYRQYAINHEVGHALGNGHVGCAKEGALAPVMMQQTFGVANDYVAKLNDTQGGDAGSVPADGKTCRPNAFPNPQAQ